MQHGPAKAGRDFPKMYPLFYAYYGFLCIRGFRTAGILTGSLVGSFY